MKKTRSKVKRADRFTVQQKRELAALSKRSEKDIDTGAIPEVRDWSGAKRGLLYRPVKQQLTLRIDADVLTWFKEHAQGRGYQTDINRALREHVKRRVGAAKRS
jgi:uncharacterized protein (DUF4415 family)